MVFAHVRDIAVDRLRRRVHRALGGDHYLCHAGLSTTAGQTRSRVSGRLSAPVWRAGPGKSEILPGEIACSARVLRGGPDMKSKTPLITLLTGAALGAVLLVASMLTTPQAPASPIAAATTAPAPSATTQPSPA